jgi:predicted HD superfamily hydrolase involved in NAD metabolism
VSVDFERAREALRERQGDPAFDHGVRVAQTAGSLALIYGIAHDEAMLAGLLHDWDRELSGDELLVRAADLGVGVDDAQAGSPKLIHAQTAAAALRREFPELSDDVIDAVGAHTLGAVSMTPLAQVVYVADMIEPSRHYKGADDLREAVGTLSLDELFALAYQQTMMHLIRSRKPLHPQTAQIYNAVVARAHDERD